ncbi:hypothetical protein TRVA0_053S00474 [Trichomonascus vanleenenianus]|uniref:uncharacterized protein n=1 Tax=Trichomonascus vanleenenianus TaxID=2268995 RepID=UPI003EC9F018
MHNESNTSVHISWQVELVEGSFFHGWQHMQVPIFLLNPSLPSLCRAKFVISPTWLPARSCCSCNSIWHSRHRFTCQNARARNYSQPVPVYMNNYGLP